jgi:hypothetical protein
MGFKRGGSVALPPLSKIAKNFVMKYPSMLSAVPLPEWFNARPHPSPLPREREELFPRSEVLPATDFARSLSDETETMIRTPSPGGEGWGEGGRCSKLSRHRLQKVRLLILGFLSLATIVPAQHFHLNIGALSQAQNSPLLFQNGGAFATNSGFVMPLTPNASGTFAGYYATASLTPTAIGTGFFDAPAPGTQVRLRFIAVQGPASGSFGVWDVPGFNEEEESTTSLTFSVPVGTSAGTQSVLLSQNDADPGADPFGHIHGRGFSATQPGLYVVSVQAYDNSANGTPTGPIHSPSVLLPIYFQAGVTIAGIARDANQTFLTFASRAGSSYYVQATGTPENSASWQDLAGPFTGNLLQTATETTTTESARFYRLRVTTP